MEKSIYVASEYGNQTHQMRKPIDYIMDETKEKKNVLIPYDVQIFHSNNKNKSRSTLSTHIKFLLDVQQFLLDLKEILLCSVISWNVKNH